MGIFLLKQNSGWPPSLHRGWWRTPACLGLHQPNLAAMRKIHIFLAVSVFNEFPCYCSVSPVWEKPAGGEESTEQSTGLPFSGQGRSRRQALLAVQALCNTLIPPPCLRPQHPTSGDPLPLVELTQIPAAGIFTKGSHGNTALLPK